MNASASFSQGLIKGVAKESVSSYSNNDEKVKITSINSKTSVKFHYSSKDGISKDYTLYKGESLSKRNNNEKDLNLIVETKDVKSESDLRGNEKQKIKCAEVFFENLKNDGYNVIFERQINNKDMGEIIKELLKQ